LGLDLTGLDLGILGLPVLELALGLARLDVKACRMIKVTVVVKKMKDIFPCEVQQPSTMQNDTFNEK
jgi:hypothetical protein